MENKIKISFWYSLYWKLVGVCNQVLIVFSLRKHREYWGIIYDSVNKQPLDPVIVKMAYVQTGRVVETCVTDLEGRYGFLARPGKFKIFAQKTNYHFPSSVITGSTDGIFDDIYHGEFFELSEEAEVVAPNIPMDPVAADWNQRAKKTVLTAHYYLEYLLKRIIAALFWFGVVALIVFAVFSSSKAAYAGLGVYVLLFFCALTVPDVRLWGRAVSSADGLPLSGILLELQLPLLNDIVMGKATVTEDGKYFLRANPGKYILVLKQQGESGPPVVLGKLPITIGSERVLNKKILIQD